MSVGYATFFAHSAIPCVAQHIFHAEFPVWDVVGEFGCGGGEAVEAVADAGAQYVKHRFACP